MTCLINRLRLSVVILILILGVGVAPVEAQSPEADSGDSKAEDTKIGRKAQVAKMTERCQEKYSDTSYHRRFEKFTQLVIVDELITSIIYEQADGLLTGYLGDHRGLVGLEEETRGLQLKRVKPTIQEMGASLSDNVATEEELSSFLKSNPQSTCPIFTAMHRFDQGHPEQLESYLSSGIESIHQRLKAYRGNEGFQKIRWGMTPKEVRQAAPGGSIVDGEYRYRKRVANTPAQISVAFAKGRAAKVSVNFISDAPIQTTETHLGILAGWSAIDKGLEAKYGDSLDISEYTDAAGMLMQSQNHQGLIMAIVTGEAEIAHRWEPPESIVINRVTGEGHRLVHTLVYDSDMYREQIRALAEENEALRASKTASEL